MNMQFKPGDIIVLKNYARKYIFLVEYLKSNIYTFRVIDSNSRYLRVNDIYYYNPLSAFSEFKLLLPSIS